MWRSRVATFATCCTGTGAELLNRDKGGIMAVDTQWATREEVAQDREKVQALTVAQVQDREKLSRLDEKIENSVRSIDRHSATQAGVEKAIDSVQSDIKSVQSDIKSVQFDIKSVQSDIKSVQFDIKSVQIELTDVKSDMRWIKWLLGIGTTAVIALLVAALVQFLRLVGGG